MLAAEGQLNTTINIEESEAGNKWKCNVCNKEFDSLYILNYHKILEHSKSKRPPIGIG
ncbi:MAG TPA: hypothetical protein VIP56_14145 [Nitrososphaeraceae archaeon]|jgi:hypothetical protein